MALCSSVLTTPLASLNSPTTSVWYQFPIEGELWFQESLLHFTYWNPPCDLEELDGIHSHKASTLMAQHLLAAAYRYGLEFSSPYLDLPPYKIADEKFSQLTSNEDWLALEKAVESGQYPRLWNTAQLHFKHLSFWDIINSFFSEKIHLDLFDNGANIIEGRRLKRSRGEMKIWGQLRTKISMNALMKTNGRQSL